MQLQGKAAIVTGSATGIGRAIALALAKEGANVVVNYTRSRAEALATVEDARRLGGRAVAVQADVSKAPEVRSMVETALAEFGRVDILVNNAGTTTYIPMSELGRVTEEVWDRIMGVNLKGAFLCAQAAVPAMRQQGGGRIINISSTAGMRPAGSSIPYCCSKAGVIMLTKCLAAGLGPQILVNAIAPGLIKTRWHDQAPADFWAGRTEATPLKRVGTPEDVAQAALFLATSADFITGEVIIVDGGWGL